MKMTNFQLIFTGVFVAFIIFGVLAFSFFTARTNSVGTVQIWGTEDSGMMNALISTLNQSDKSFQGVSYIQKPAATYQTDVINAMASGSGPDIILLGQDQLESFTDKVDTIPYSAVSQADFSSSYVDESQLFLTPTGPLALPFLIDPLVLYWNRDLLTTAGLGQPPQYWDTLLTQAQKLTKLDASNNITQSAIALGGWDNIANAKDILSALFMQAGDPITGYNGSGTLTSVFGQTPQGATENPASSALQFYTEFVNPSKVTYSWNRSLPDSEDAFAAGTLALYVGYASQYSALSTRNPNLHFGVAVLPQIQGNSTHSTFGELTGLAIPRTASNPTGALTIAEKLSSQTGIAEASKDFALPPVRTDVSIDTSSNAISSTLYQSALISRGWLDPNPSATSDIFSAMVDAVVSNKSLPDAAVQDGAQSLEALIPTTPQ